MSIPVEQVDREAAADLAQWLTDAQIAHNDKEIWFARDFSDSCREGLWDNHPWVESFAAHRIAAEEAQKERDAVIASRWGHLSADQYQNAEPDDQREHVIARLIATAIRGQGR